MTVSSPPVRGRLRRALRELMRSDADIDARARRRELDPQGAYPAPYPTGWYRVANSDELKPGQLVRVRCMDEELVVYRGESGSVHVVDAHCPHQGADLGVDGCVEGDGLRCPFHHWRFDGEGRVREIPGLDKLPRIGLRTWPVRELHGMVWIFRQFDGAVAEPPYELPEQADIVSGERVYRGEWDAGTVDMHLIEFAENSVDFQHFGAIHGRMLVPWTRVEVPGITIRHEPYWRVDETQPHVTYFGDHANLELLGRPIPRTSADAEITIFGPGGIVWFRFDVPDVGKITLFQTHTPVGPRRQRIYFRWYAEPRVPRVLVHYVVGSWISNWRADISIWENKVYRQKPMLCRIDGPVAKMRRWYRQFYKPAAPMA